MAQVLKVQQVPSSSSSMNGLEKNGNGLIEDSATSSTSLTHIQNGLFHGTPTKDLNGASTSLEDDLQLSPSDLRRRSTRASALKAQEKIKLKDDIVQGPQKRTNDDEENPEGVENSEDVMAKGSSPKKRRLEDGREFDQTCFRFGLRSNDDGEVYAMTDESENSSIHDSEMEVVRYHYEKMKNREPDEETLRERLKMRREAESALRQEEAHLMVLKKMKDSQNRAISKLAAETKAADLAEAANAYKPVLAAAAGKMSANGKNLAAVNAQKTMAGLANLSVTQQLELLGKLASQSPAAKQAYTLAKKNPQQTTQLFGQLIALNSLQIQKQKEAAAEAATVQATAQAQAQVQQVQQVQQAQMSQQQKLMNQQTPAQRIQAARLAFRAQADKQLMTIPTQKSQPHDITFLPNPNASAFLALHGLDIVVQHVLKDNSFYKKYDGPAYECEECKTDRAHTWKAIGSAPDDLHLYCENCVRAAQKRKNRQDQTSLLKRAFQKITAQEKEFEKKIAEGQLEQFAEAKAAVAPTPVASSSSSTQQIPTSSTATVSSTPLGPRLPNMPSSSGTSTPTQAMKTSVPLPSTPKSSSSSNKKTLSAQQQQQQAQMNMMMNQLKNPAMMAQMLQMFMAQQMAQQRPANGGGASASGMNAQQQQMVMLLAQAQATMAAQAQAAQAAAQAQAAQAAQQAKNAAAREQQQQQQQAMLMAAAMFQGGLNQQALQQLSKMTPAHQKLIIEKIQQQQQQQKK